MNTSPTPPENEIQIRDLSRAGSGVGTLADGRIAFIPFTAPGDSVNIEIEKEHKNYVFGKKTNLLTASPERTQPRCPVFERCGGCEWQHLPYERQWNTKVLGVLHALKRVGIPNPASPLEIPAAHPWNYRNRIQLRLENGKIGYFARGSHELIPIERCEIARPELNAALAVIQKKVDAGEIPSHPAAKLELEVLASGRVVESWNRPHAAQGFRQVNDEQNKKLQAWVEARIPDQARVLDLFGGTGNLVLGLASRVKSVDSVDVSAPRDGASPISHLRFHRSSVLSWCLKTRKIAAQDSSIQFTHAIIDPPREGLGRDAKEIVLSLENLQVQEALLVGCDPDSWAKDVSVFVKSGWELTETAVLDLFAQTHHVEALARLTRIQPAAINDRPKNSPNH